MHVDTDLYFLYRSLFLLNEMNFSKEANKILEKTLIQVYELLVSEENLYNAYKEEVNFIKY